MALCPPLLTTTGGPRANSHIQSLSLGCCYLWRGDSAPSERLQDAGLSLEEADFSCVAAGQTGFCPSGPLSSASAPLTKQNRGLCWKMWRGSKTSLQYFSQFLSIVTWGGVPLEMKSRLPLIPWVRSLRWIFFSQVIYFSWKLTAVLGVSFFDRTMAFPTESKWALFRRNASCQKAMYGSDTVSVYIQCICYCPLLFMQTAVPCRVPHLLRRTRRDCYRCWEFLYWHHWEFCHWFQQSYDLKWDSAAIGLMI